MLCLHYDKQLKQSSQPSRNALTSWPHNSLLSSGVRWAQVVEIVTEVFGYLAFLYEVCIVICIIQHLTQHLLFFGHLEICLLWKSYHSPSHLQRSAIWRWVISLCCAISKPCIVPAVWVCVVATPARCNLLANSLPSSRRQEPTSNEVGSTHLVYSFLSSWENNHWRRLGVNALSQASLWRKPCKTSSLALPPPLFISDVSHGKTS